MGLVKEVSRVWFATWQPQQPGCSDWRDFESQGDSGPEREGHLRLLALTLCRGVGVRLTAVGGLV